VDDKLSFPVYVLTDLVYRYHMKEREFKAILKCTKKFSRKSSSK
jgi:hypothetical protein